MSTRSLSHSKAVPKPSFTPVGSGLLQRKCACGKSSGLSGECSECQSKGLTLQRRSANQAEPDEVPPIVHEVLRESGQALDLETRAFMESHFGHDFSRVRVHTDPKAAQSAQAVNAQAYTVGNHLVFGTRQFAPQTQDGLWLLTHELTHAVQQRHQVDFSAPLRLGSPHTVEERIADRIAEVVTTSSPAANPASQWGATAALADSDAGSSSFTQIAPTSTQVARQPATETWQAIHQRILQGMIKIVKQYTKDGEDRLEALTEIFATMPADEARRLYNRLEPGAPKDDFAQYFKNNFPQSRALGLASLRQKFLSEQPSLAASQNSEPTLKGETIGKQIAVAGCQLPVNKDDPVHVKFGNSIVGDGYIHNPKYWIVEYTLIKDTKTKTFVSSKAQPSPWRQANEFLENDQKKYQEWQEPIVDILIKIGFYGASAAINDVWNFPDQYAIDCLGAATLTQLRGIYLSYPESYRDAAFDRDYNSFFMERFGKTGKLPKSSLESDLDVVLLKSPISLSEWIQGNQTSDVEKLNPGDQLPIENSYMPLSSAWRTENVVYLGSNQFFGHPIGVVTPQEYAKKLAQYINPSYVAPEIGRRPPEMQADLEEFILEHSYIRSYSRPRSRSAEPPTFGTGTPKSK